jgi:hypothetical protein
MSLKGRQLPSRDARVCSGTTSPSTRRSSPRRARRRSGEFREDTGRRTNAWRDRPISPDLWISNDDTTEIAPQPRVAASFDGDSPWRNGVTARRVVRITDQRAPPHWRAEIIRPLATVIDQSEPSLVRFRSRCSRKRRGLVRVRDDRALNDEIRQRAPSHGPRRNAPPARVHDRAPRPLPVPFRKGARAKPRGRIVSAIRGSLVQDRDLVRFRAFTGFVRCRIACRISS